MNVTLIPFQRVAVDRMRMLLAEALGGYHRTGDPQVVSLQAPTGAGKTIMVASLIENVYAGMTTAAAKTYEEQPEAIFVWLSDSPELNEQSKQKIELKTSRLTFGQCVTITEESFDREVLEDGYIYFLNTQKITKAAKLTSHGDGRQYTIWETLENTVRKKSDRFYFIIDEAHRGAKTKRAAGTDTTIMQRFIKGYEYYDEAGHKHKMPPMPVVLGMSATAARFNTLIGNTNSCLHRHVITTDDVRSSGLLKDRIAIIYPDDPEKNNDMVMLESAAREWKKKCTRWYQYTYEQHYANVDPVFVIQVCPGSNGALSDTNLEDMLAKIEETVEMHFREGEVVHCFGDASAISVNGLTIPHVNASEIVNDHRIKIVLFKEALSTGWDCPRAETMMSYRTAHDPTYIAQLLGRMIRTPLQNRVLRDDFLNDVKLYLPHFDKTTVKSVVDELQSNEGSEIPTEINGESLEEHIFVTWMAHTPRRPHQATPDADQMSFDEWAGNSWQPSGPQSGPVNTAPEYIPPKTFSAPASGAAPEIPAEDLPQGKQLAFQYELDREAVARFINSQGYLTYFIRKDRISDYLQSLLDLADLLTHNAIYQGARDEVIHDIVGMIRGYVENLHSTGRYDELAKQVMQFKLSVQVFDPFGSAIHEHYFNDLCLMSETDIDRQLRNADAKLGRYGFPNIYGRQYYDDEDPNKHKIDCILFAADDAQRAVLGEYAKRKLHELARKYRLAIVNKSDACKRKYHNILADCDIVSEQIFSLPENISVREDSGGTEYKDHLFVSEETGIAKIRLNGWESSLIEEESHRTDFVCWLRNPDRASWALCLPYEIGGETKAFYPDFLIVRSDPALDYVVDILEPHGDQYADNLPKAKALAKYAAKEDRFGRIQLIRKSRVAGGNDRFIRLELTDLAVREKVLRANNDDDLRNIFTTEGTVE